MMNETGIQKTEAEHLAGIIHAIRGDWDVRGILAAIAKVRTRPLAKVTVAAVLAAGNPAAKTPGLIAMDGEHWAGAARAVDSEADRHPAAVPWGERCETCGKDRIGCESGRLDGDEHPFLANHDKVVLKARAERAERERAATWSPSAKAYVRPDLRAQMRAELEAARQANATKAADLARKRSNARRSPAPEPEQVDE